MNGWLKKRRQLSHHFFIFSAQVLGIFLPNKKSDVTSLLLKMTIQRQIDELIEKQISLRKKKINTCHYSDDNQTIVQAIQECKIIVAWQEVENVTKYFDRVLPDMKKLVECYEDNSNDQKKALYFLREIEDALIIKARICNKIK